MLVSMLSWQLRDSMLQTAGSRVQSLVLPFCVDCASSAHVARLFLLILAQITLIKFI